MAALAVTIVVLFVLWLPAVAVGYLVGRGRRRRGRDLRPGYVAIRPRAPAREVIREARRVARQPRFGDDPAGGGFPRSEP